MNKHALIYSIFKKKTSPDSTFPSSYYYIFFTPLYSETLWKKWNSFIYFL